MNNTTLVINPVAVMKRYELKYIISGEQESFLKAKLKGHLYPDEFGKTSIASLYYDTPDYRFIRLSNDKPMFKEKLRLRSYGLADNNSPVFLELKRKAYGVVYKRRIRSTIQAVEDFINGESDDLGEGQINKELSYFISQNKLIPSCLIIYDRTAYYEPNGDLRLTIDNNPRFRLSDLDLRISMQGEPLLPDGYSILEVKVQGAMPLWLSKILDEGKMYKTGFSKYGEAYKRLLVGNYRR
ncbi:MAG: polyphosphate polymerase domain-containing protein [Ruminococcus sp.]|jgi:SPX domain protein involved in polyphosphate accumulation|nr:polyphosphate polymerase domain-containing protein [Ruminococcus sp.]